MGVNVVTPIEFAVPPVPDEPSTPCPSCGRPLAPGAGECPACTSLADTAMPPRTEPVDLIAGRYLPQRMLGRGGAKEVWLAHDLTLDRPVAHRARPLRRGRAPRPARGCGARRA